VQVLVTAMQGFIYRFAWDIHHHSSINSTQMQALLEHSILYMLMGSALISLFIYARLYKRKEANLWANCDFSTIKVKIIGFAVLLGASFNLFFVMFDIITSFDRLFPGYEKIMEPLMGGDFILTLIIVGIIIPIFEEILFRGIVFNELKEILPFTLALLIQGFIFGAYHLNVLQGIYGMILGIFAALVYEWFHSIWAPISVHAAFNTLSIVMSKIANERIMSKYGPELLIFSGLILGVTIYWLSKIRIRTVKVVKYI
jgi:uncharacterized protein